MIPRYARPEMTAIWSPETRFSIWLEIETLAMEAMGDLGVIPTDAAQSYRTKAKFEVDRIDAIEREVRHDVIAFLTNVAEHVGEDARFAHQGMTSSDVLDTCLSVQLAQATTLLLAGIERVMHALEQRALDYRHTPCIGRSHGIHAEPTTFGLKLLGHYAEFRRNHERLLIAQREIATCMISGAVGTFAQVDPRVEQKVAWGLEQKYGIEFAVEKISTQVIPRDRHAAFFAALGVVAAGIERLATEIRHLQRTEVLEAEEYFEPGQKGSSAMPHKRNPVLTENLCGLARLVRSAVTPALENVALWHERDISHSSVERGIGPDATIHLDFALHRLAGVIEKLVVYPDAMARNLALLGGLHNSQRVMLALTQAGVSREDAYRLVQRSAMAVWQAPAPRAATALLDRLRADPDIAARLSSETLGACFDDAHHFARVDEIFARVFA